MLTHQCSLFRDSAVEKYMKRNYAHLGLRINGYDTMADINAAIQKQDCDVYVDDQFTVRSVLFSSLPTHRRMRLTQA